jgi:hypothetical protein
MAIDASLPKIYDVDPLLAPGLHYGEIYWQATDNPTQRGQMPEVKNPPTSGRSQAFLIDRGGKLVTLFCPFTLESFQVTRTSAEVKSMTMNRLYEPNPKEPGTYRPCGWKEFTDERRVNLACIVRRNWAMACRLSLPSIDYDVAALVLTMLGADVPAVSSTRIDPNKERGGKQVDVEVKYRAIKRESKRGVVVGFFWGRSKTVREAMAELGMSRSNILSHLFCAQRDNNCGYKLVGETVSIELPDGVDQPFAV